MAELKNTVINDTGYLQLPVGTTAQRPGSPVNGDMRFNSGFKIVETYVDGAWKYLPPIVEGGLILQLNAAEPASYPGTGTTWTDLSPTGSDVTLNGSVSYSSSPSGNLDFPNVISSASDNLMAALGIVSGTDNDVAYSMEAIINIDAAPAGISTDAFSIMGHATSQGIGLQVEGPNPHINFGYRSNSNYSTPDNTITVGQWHYVVATRNQGGGTTAANLNIYIDGVLQFNTTAGDCSVDYTTAAFQVGSADTRIGTMNGKIAYCAVYSRALSVPEIQQNFNALRGRYGI